MVDVFRHVSVLLNEVVEHMALRPGGVYVDGTAGGGGHALGLLEKSEGSIRMILVDRDAWVLEQARRRLDRFADRCSFVHGNYSEIRQIVSQSGVGHVDGVLMDLGVSSFQLDMADRGFSFRLEGPLDMRMDASQELTAADIVNTWDEIDLKRILREYGEERMAGTVAAAIVRERGKSLFRTTTQLASLVERVKGAGAHGGSGRRRIHAATLTFQALRIAVNDELAGLDVGLSGGLDVLNPGGRLAVIAFHSLEDRRVKTFMRSHVGRDESLPESGSRWVGEEPRARDITRKAVKAEAAEAADNPRARSARLRVIERM